MRIYVLSFDNYNDAMRALRKLKKRGVTLHSCILIVSTSHHNKVKDFLSHQKERPFMPQVTVLVLQ